MTGARVERNAIVCGDALTILQSLPSNTFHCSVTSPPYYGLRDYQEPGQIGLEETPEAYVAKLVAIFREVRQDFFNTATMTSPTWKPCGCCITVKRVRKIGIRVVKGWQKKDQVKKPEEKKVQKDYLEASNITIQRIRMLMEEANPATITVASNPRPSYATSVAS